MINACRIAVGFVFVIATTCCAVAADVDYLKDIKPLLTERCYACHGVLKAEGNLRLDTAAAAIQGGDSGPAITAGDAPGSLLIQRISAHDESERMPPEGEPLTAVQIELIRQWITQRAPAPADEKPEADPRAHWAFQVPVRAQVPTVQRIGWQSNPIDAFITAQQAQRGLTPQPPAEKGSWLRRVYLDLIGIPPTLEEYAAFSADDSPEAYERVVDQLLESPLYGQRWGRHWMDVWRYSDWWGLGAEVRNSQKHIWHWRDWVVESLNADKGYDQMLREMLAADELYPNDLDRLRAGGFLARQYFKFNRTTWMDGVVEHTSKAMLGLTTNCAKCHDHKYDPISQAEYYQFRAIFEPYQLRTDAIPGELDHERNGIPRPFDCNLDATTSLHIRGDDRNPDPDTIIKPGVPAIVAPVGLNVQPVTLPPEAYQPGLRPFVVEAHLTAARGRIADRQKDLNLARGQLAQLQTGASASEALVRDDFTDEKADLWELSGSGWAYRDGHLQQSSVGNQRAALRFKGSVPQDFEAQLKYIPTGGEQWKSVGITFDVNSNGNEVLAYLSAHSVSPKAQVSYLRDGQHVYPGEGARRVELPLNQPHELRLQVREQLVNVWADGQLAVAYRLPIPRQLGALQLITFDAAATFLEFELRPLPQDTKLVEASAVKPAIAEGAPRTLEQAQLSVRIAEQSLAVAEAELLSVQARATADRARFLEAHTDATLKPLLQEAARSEKAVAAATAELAVSKAEVAVLQVPADKQAEAAKKLEAARQSLTAAQESLAQPGETYTSLSGAYKTLESNVETEESRRKPFPTTSTGRRTALANWLTDRQQPLTARVAVNHLWLRHFGRPLVATVFDFGRKGARPTHPELLDWLAVEFMEQGWSMKHMHRLMVTSQVYRLSSSSLGADPATLASDPENVWYWRMNPIRMEAQTVRDSLLSLAGELDLAMGGPSIPVNVDSRRRSLYYVHSHNDHQPFLAMFDDASVLDCYRRSESIVPQQALALENSGLATQMAEKIATKLQQVHGDPAAFVTAGFELILGSSPSDDERTLMLNALRELEAAASRQARKDPARAARAQLVQALLNHNDFVTVR